MRARGGWAESELLRRWFFGLLLVHIVTAFFSFGMFHCDEHFQIIEFVGYKLGWLNSSDLAWEFTAKIRPWLQPALYFFPVWLLNTAGLENPLDLSAAMRILSGVLGWGSLAYLSQTLFRMWGRTPRAFWLTLFFSSFYFFPLLHVRTSSESFSTSLLMLATAVYLQIVSNQKNTRANFAALGFLLGLAFEARFQTAFAGLGLALFLFFSGGEKMKCFVFGTSGGLAALFLGALADRWGYGQWVFPAYEYATVNLLEGKAAEFGVSPWWSYFQTFRKFFVAPYGFAILIGILTSFTVAFTWLYRRKQPEPLVAAVVAMLVPFFVVHMLIGHKEDRFLLPMLWGMWLLFLVCVGEPLFHKLRDRPALKAPLQWAFKAYVVLSFVLFLRAAFNPINPHAPLFRVLQAEARRTDNLTLIAAEGHNPYALGCFANPECSQGLAARFLQPRNLTVDCSVQKTANTEAWQGSVVLQRFTIDQSFAVPPAPPGCQLLASTLYPWVPVVADGLTDELRKLAFKNFSFRVLWDCRSQTL